MPADACLRTDSSLAVVGDDLWRVDVAAGSTHVELSLPGERAVLRVEADGESFVLPSDPSTTVLEGAGWCWVLPADPTSSDPSWRVSSDGTLRAEVEGDRVRVATAGASLRVERRRGWPRADVDGGEVTLDLPGGDALTEALAGFGWGTMLPSVVERTRAADHPDGRGFVLSTLDGTYLGTYPDVDHEFQIKGRLAWGSAADHDVVRRMIELQLRLMAEDPQQLWRNPCSVQPDGTREYHVRRSSMDGSANAVMFLLTGNIEVVESVWLYVARTKDRAWLAGVIADLEGAMSCVTDCVDARGRLWSDVYYEDQVIKDGRETMAAALAVRSYGLLAELEDLLDRGDQAAALRGLRDRVARAIGLPLPVGSWDPVADRFVDWVDRAGGVHDHVHLLANVLPVLVGAAGPEQRRAVEGLVEAEADEFQRFPTFLAARVQDYTDDEIGDGGPYDLCAAGRYWCWDAAWWHALGRGDMLRDQLMRVAEQGAIDGYVMGERYDMGHVYYVDGSPWHGAAHYYEYPCVFTWVLVHEYLGVRGALDVDLLLAPRLVDHGTVTLEQAAYRLRYEVAADGFTLENLADVERTFRLDLAGLFPGSELVLEGSDGDPLTPDTVVRLESGERVRVVAR